MKIIESDWNWAVTLVPRASTTQIILHHAAADGVSAEDIHRFHLARGWSGIAYHYYVRKDGGIWRGRPENSLGGHTRGWNFNSIGVCFEGDFQKQQMPEEQKQAGLELVRDIRRRYKGIAVLSHGELSATACPGKYFPMEEFREDTMTGEEIARALEEYYAARPLPQWAEAELAEAVALGITDGSAPMELIPRYQSAIMALRAFKAGENK